MKGFKRIISIIVALMLVCSSIPLSVLASNSDSRWSDTNLVEGQADIVLNDYTPRWLNATLDAESAYKVNFNIVASATEGYRLTTLALRDPDGYGQSGLYIVFNGVDDQIRIGYEYTTNTSLIAVAAGAGITAAGTYEVEVITYADAIEVYLNGNLVSFTDMVSGTYQQITQVSTKTFSDGMVGFMAQGSVLDAQITNIGIYGEKAAEEEADSIWSDTNLVAGQADITLNDYNARWLSATLDAESAYKVNFNIVASATEGYRLTTLALRDPDGYGQSGLYIVFNGVDDQIRIGYEYTTNTSLIAVAAGAGITAAGTYEVEVITYADAIEVYLNGNLVSFTDMVSGTYQQITQVSTKTFSDGMVGFMAQGSVLDAQITNIGIYGEKAAEEEADSIWSDTNLVAGQADITLNDYNARWLSATLDAENAYKVNFNIVASATEGYRLTTLALRDPDGYGQSGLYIVFNGVDDQIRIGYEYTTNTSLIAVAAGAGITAAGTYEVEVITYADAIEVYLNGNLVSFTDMVSGTYQQITQVSTKTFSDGMVGFMAQGSVLDAQITNIGIYGEKAAEEEADARWSDTNLVGNQADITLNDYAWDWLPVDIKADQSYKYSFNLVLTDTEGYRLPTIAVRDSSADSNGTEGLYIVFYGVEDQIRIGYEATTYSSLIGVAKNVGMGPAGTYAVEIISTPDTISVSINGTPVTFYDYSDGQSKQAVSVSGLKDGKAGFNAQGNVMDTVITDIAIYGEKAAEEEADARWSDTNLVGNQADITLNDYAWDWLPVDIKADQSYKYSFNLVLTDTEGYRLPTIAVRDSSADSNGTEGLYIVFYGVEDQIRIGYEATTYSSLIGVAKNVGMGPAGTYAVEIISTPDTISVSINGTPVTFYDYSDGQSKQAVSVSGLKDGKAGFNAQGNVMDTVITDIAIYGEKAAEEEADARWSDTNLVGNQADITLNDYAWDWLPVDIKADQSYKYSFNLVLTDTEGYRLPTIAVRDSSADSNGTEGLYIVFYGVEDQIRIGYEATTYSSLIGVAKNVGMGPAGTYAVEIISTPDTISVSINGTPVTFYDYSDGQSKQAVSVSGLKDGKAGFNAQGTVMDCQVTDIAIYGEADAEAGGGTEDEVTTGPVWSTENLVAGQADIVLNNYEAKYLDVELDKHTGYRLDYTITFNTNVAGNWNYMSNMLRQTESDLISFGAWNDAGDGTGQLRFAENDISNAAQSAVEGVGTITAGVEYPVSIVIMPDYLELYIGGQIQTMYLTAGGTGTQIPVSKRIANGKVGFIGQGSHPDITISNIALYVDTNGADAPAIDQVAVDAVIAQIAAIGTVSKNSGDAIAAAREAYDALNDDEKVLVTNISTLTEAEAVYNQLNASQDIMLYSLSATDAMGYNHWPSALGITNVAGGGMAFNWNGAGTNVRQGVNRSVKLDGLHAVFSGYDITSGKKQFAIYFADIDSKESYTQINNQNDYMPLALIVNADNGTLGIASSETNYPITIIATSDMLKYEALAGKEWSLFMNDNGDGSYTVTVNGVSGVITKAMFDACNKLTQKEDVYLTICPWSWGGGVVGNLNLISLHDGDSACANDLTSEEMDEVIGLINEISSIGIVTKDSKDAIEACEAKYASLNDKQKGCVVNYSVLVAARYRYDQLTQDVDEPCLNYYSISTADLAGTNYWSDILLYSDIADGGVKFEWRGGGTNMRRLINREVTLDGLHMVFGGLEAEDSVKKVAFYLADLYDTAADWTSLYSEYVQGEPSIVALIFDFSKGTLTAHVEGQTDVVIINDSRISYEYLKDTVWDMKVEKNSDGDYVFTVAGATGILPASLCDAANRLTDRDNSMYVTISPWTYQYFDLAIDVLAIHGNAVVCAEDLTNAQVTELNKVIEAIYAIYTEDGKIVPESEEKYLAAWELYDALDPSLQPLVANYAYLVLAEEVLDVVLAIEGIGTVTYESGDLIDQIRQMYKLLAVDNKETVGTVYQRVQIDTDKRLIVGNYETLEKAISDYYNIRKQLDLYGYESDTVTDNKQDNTSNNTGDKVSPNTSDDMLFTSVIMLSAIVAVAVLIYRKKIRKES